jgi:hypothetical protein
MRRSQNVLTNLSQSMPRLTWMILAALLTLNACKPGGQPSDEQIEDAKTRVAQIRDSLYVPKDATLLTDTLTYSTNPRLYPGCVVGLVYMSYRTPRSFEDVLDEYREALKAAGWEPSPDHRHDQVDVDFFVEGPQVFLEIASVPLRPDLLPVSTPAADQNSMTYYLGLSYYAPSRRECSES